MDFLKELTIVIPAYNEEKRIGNTLKGVVSFLKKYDVEPHEIIVVDDGSKDKTEEVVLSFSKQNPGIKFLKNKRNMGKGYSIKKGMLNANGNYILFTDADLSTPMEEIEKFARFIKRYDVIIGSRRMNSSKVLTKQPLYRRIPGKVFPILTNLLVVGNIRDTQCGFKLFKKNAAKYLFKRQRLNGFSFDAEVLYIAKKSRMRIKEIPIEWKNDPNSKLNVFTDSMKMFLELLKIRWNGLRGVYKK